jgi:hypothetical protein
MDVYDAMVCHGDLRSTRDAFPDGLASPDVPCPTIVHAVTDVAPVRAPKRRRQPLTAPAARPTTRNRCAYPQASTTGALIRIEAADSCPHGTTVADDHRLRPQRQRLEAG